MVDKTRVPKGLPRQVAKLMLDVGIVPEGTPVELGDADLVDEFNVVDMEVRERDGVSLSGVAEPDHCRSCRVERQT